MDALSDVLRVVKLSGGVFLQAEFTEPWCLVSEVTPENCAPLMPVPEHLILYHYVAEGGFHLRLEGEPQTEVETGDIVIMPRNDQHLMGSDLSVPPATVDDMVRQALSDSMEKMSVGGGGRLTRVVCGFLGCDCVTGNPLIETLPPMLRFNIRDSSAADWIQSSLNFAANEISEGRPGSDTLLSKLSEVLFVEAVRRYVDALGPDQTGWLAGLKDDHVSRALTLLHTRVAEPWTVDALGREIGLSRSALADRFTRLIGVSPMHYLTGWRMQVAASRLRNGLGPIAQIAADVGYDTEASFSRAFKRTFGMPPATWRGRNAPSQQS